MTPSDPCELASACTPEGEKTTDAAEVSQSSGIDILGAGSMGNPQSEEIDVAQLLGWTEFGCWMALIQAPIIYWLQGPSVSNDQFVVRTALVVIAATGGVSLRLYALLKRRGSARGHSAGAESFLVSESPPA